MISALQERASSAVKVMEQSSQQAHFSVSHAQQASTALTGIGRQVNEITEMNTRSPLLSSSKVRLVKTLTEVLPIFATPPI
jgi:methyl-accepting chemotaxis protein